MIITSFEQFRYLPQNRGKDTKTIYNEWLLEESKLMHLMEAYHMISPTIHTGLTGPAGASTSSDQGETVEQELITESGIPIITESGTYLIA